MVNPFSKATHIAAIVFLALAIADEMSASNAFQIVLYIFVFAFLVLKTVETRLETTSPAYRALARIRNSIDGGPT